MSTQVPLHVTGFERRAIMILGSSELLEAASVVRNVLTLSTIEGQLSSCWYVQN